LVAEPFAPAHPPLPNVSEEIGAITALLPTGSIMDLVDTGSADPTADPLDTYMASVLRCLPEAAILHLACHGIQDDDDPLNSGFWLRDGRLTLSSLMRLNLPNAFFAFLSACETAKGDEDHPNQAVHLAAAMLFVGFRSVIGTMWFVFNSNVAQLATNKGNRTMGDNDGPLVAQTVYSQLMKSGLLDIEVIPYALDDAVQAIQAQNVAPNRWATFIHIGA
jgi:CHAT domain-containing protein